jgi:hypothetical protein
MAMLWQDEGFVKIYRIASPAKNPTEDRKT